MLAARGEPQALGSVGFQAFEPFRPPLGVEQLPGILLALVDLLVGSSRLAPSKRSIAARNRSLSLSLSTLILDLRSVRDAWAEVTMIWAKTVLDSKATLRQGGSSASPITDAK